MSTIRLEDETIPNLPAGTFLIPQIGIYIKRQEAFKPLLKHLALTGYRIRTEYGLYASLRDSVLLRVKGTGRKVYQGKEYGEWERLPIPDGICIYKAWEGYPIGPSLALHEEIIHSAGMVSDCGYYYQDGRGAFGGIHFLRMRLFVEHLTTLDLKEWDEFARRAPCSGPGFIRACAAFCQGTRTPQYTDKPNIGNLIVGFCKAMSGEPMTHAEHEETLRAIANKDIKDEFISILRKK